MPNPFEFLQEVRQEAAKVSWPSRNEVLITTAMVLVMVIASSIFFVVADNVLSFAVAQVLGIGHR